MKMNIPNRSSALGLLFLLLSFAAIGQTVRAQQFVPPPLDGGKPNRIAQLAACKKLQVVSFDELSKVNNAAFTLLKNTHGEKVKSVYKASSVYDNAVLLNTAAAVASIGADLSSAVILKPYLRDKVSENTSFQRLPYGFYLKGFKGIPTPPPGNNAQSDRYRDQGSVEVQTDENGETHFDVDLYNPNSDYRKEHWAEVAFNEKYDRPTHPGDVVIQLLADRKLKTGVTCKK